MIRNLMKAHWTLLVVLALVGCGGSDGDGDDGDTTGSTDVMIGDRGSTGDDTVEMDLLLPDGKEAPDGPGNEEFLVNQTIELDQMNPAVTVLSDDRFVIAWQSGRPSQAQDSQDGDGWGVIGRRFLANAAPESDEFSVNGSVADHQQLPDLVAFSDGTYAAVWESANQDGSLKGVYLQRFSSNGARQGNEVQVNTTTAGSQSIPRFSVNDSDEFLVVWQSSGSQDGDAEGVYAQMFGSMGVRKGTETQVNTYTDDGQTDPAVAPMGDGGFAVTWGSMAQDNGIGYGVYGQRLDNNAQPVAEEFIINTEISGQQEVPALAPLPNGGFVVIWQSFPGQDGDGSGIFGQAYTGDGTRSGLEFQVNSFTPGHQTVPRVATFPNSKFVVVWQSCPSGDTAEGGDGVGCGVYGQIFDAPGAPTGGIFQVNQVTIGNQERPVVATFSNNAFVVAWSAQSQDDPEDPDSWAVKARYFPAGWTPAVQ